VDHELNLLRNALRQCTNFGYIRQFFTSLNTHDENKDHIDKMGARGGTGKQICGSWALLSLRGARGPWPMLAQQTKAELCELTQ
jgi:hypothetical protein